MDSPIIDCGPNRIEGEIYSSGFSFLKETYKTDIVVYPMTDPYVINGTITIGNETHDVVNIEILFTLRTLHMRIVYIPKEGFTTTVIVYFENFKECIFEENCTFDYTGEIIDGDEDDLKKALHIKLCLSKKSTRILCYAVAIV